MGERVKLTKPNQEISVFFSFICFTYRNQYQEDTYIGQYKQIRKKHTSSWLALYFPFICFTLQKSVPGRYVHWAVQTDKGKNT